MNNLYINPKGQLYKDYKFLSWQLCSPIDGIHITQLDRFSADTQRDTQIITENNERLDFLANVK